MPSFKTLGLAALLALPLLAQAQSYPAGELTLEQPWSREMPPTAPTAAAYLTIHNHGTTADRLVGAATPVAGKAELHEHAHVDGLMKMRQVAAIEIPAGGEVKLAPMGYHVMFFDLPKLPRDGERFPLTLEFEKAGNVEVEVTVRKDAPAAMDHGHGEHHQH